MNINMLRVIYYYHFKFVKKFETNFFGECWVKQNLEVLSHDFFQHVCDDQPAVTVTIS